MSEAAYQLHGDERVDQVRVPPNSIEAEQAVLGGLMISPDAWADVADLIRAEDFYRRDHQMIFQVIHDFATAEPPKPFDAVTLGDWFKSTGQEQMVDNGDYLIDLARNTWTVANIRAHAKIVADKATLRALITAGTETVNDGFQPDGRDAAEIVASAAARVSSLTLRSARDGGLVMIRSGLGEVRTEIEARYEGTIEVGLPPPWGTVRDILPGLEDTDFMVIAARPGMGKTVAGMEFADEAASQGRNVAVFSLEMSRAQLLTRMIARRARVDQTTMRRKGALSDDEWSRITQAQRELYALPMAIDDTAELGIDALTARALRMHAKVEGGLGLVVVDYLQLMSGDGRRDEKRYEEVTKISRGLKLLAKRVKCPVIGLSQLNRELEKRTDKRPIMSDLRESGAIEQDADIIAFLYRDDYYSKDECGAPGVAEFIVAKYRNGSPGTAYLKHHLECSYFADYCGKKPFYGKPKTSRTAPDGFDDDVPISGRDRATGADR